MREPGTYCYVGYWCERARNILLCRVLVWERQEQIVKSGIGVREPGTDCYVGYWFERPVEYWCERARNRLLCWVLVWVLCWVLVWERQEKDCYVGYWCERARKIFFVGYWCERERKRIVMSGISVRESGHEWAGVLVHFYFIWLNSYLLKTTFNPNQFIVKLINHMCRSSLKCISLLNLN